MLTLTLMAITATYSDGRKVVSSGGKVKEYNASGKRVIRLVKYKSKTGGTRYAKASSVQIKGLTKRETQNILPIITAAQQEAARKNSVARAVIESLQRSRERQSAKINRQIMLMELTPSGRKNLRVLQTQQARNYLKKIKNAPYNKSYKEKIRAFVRENQPQKREKFTYKVTILGDTYGTNDKRQAKFLQALKKTIARDQAFKKDFNNAVRSAGLNLNRGDSTAWKAYKGAGQAGLAFLFSGRFLANAVDKLVIGTAGILTPKSRKAVIQEAWRAAKLTPKTVAQSLDPRKSENWANIILIAIAVNNLAAARLKINNLKSLRTAKNKVKEQIRTVKTARLKAAKTNKKTTYKKLLKQEKRLVANRNRLNAKIKKAQKVEAVKKLKAERKLVKAGMKKRARLDKKISRRITKEQKKFQKNKQAYIKKTQKKQARREAALIKKTQRKATKGVYEKRFLKELGKEIRNTKGISKVRLKDPSSTTVEVTAANGQVLLLKQATKASAVTKTKTALVKPKVVQATKVYYKEVLAVARAGKAITKSVSVAKNLHGKYKALFRYGTVPKVDLVKSSFSAIGAASKGVTSIGARSRAAQKLSQKLGRAQVASVNNLTKQANNLAVSIAALSAVKISVVQVQRLLLRYKRIKLRLKKITKNLRLKLKFKRKKRPKKKVLDEWDKVYSKLNRKYRPSLAAILFGIYGHKPKVISGLELRPLLRKKKNANRKKRRVKKKRFKNR